MSVSPVCMSVAPFVYLASRSQKKALDPMELEWLLATMCIEY